MELILLSPNKGELPAFCSPAVSEEASLGEGGFAFPRVVRLKMLFADLVGRWKGKELISLSRGCPVRRTESFRFKQNSEHKCHSGELF